MNWEPRSPCATCGVCCRSYVVGLCGYDVWRISTGQQLGPEQFVVPIPQETPGEDGFRLEVEGPVFGLALDKRGRLDPGQPCIFLVRLEGGYDRCGIYEHRPVVCQTYPMSLWYGGVYQNRKSLCPPGAWSNGETRDPSWRVRLQRLNRCYDMYHEVVARWNARVTASGQGIDFSPFEYYSYLMNVYDRLAGLEASLGSEAMAAIEASWPGIPRPSDPNDLLAMFSGPWLDYFRAARRIIDAFYPLLPSLPPKNICTVEVLKSGIVPSDRSASAAKPVA